MTTNKNLQKQVNNLIDLFTPKFDRKQLEIVVQIANEIGEDEYYIYDNMKLFMEVTKLRLEDLNILNRMYSSIFIDAQYDLLTRIGYNIMENYEITIIGEGLDIKYHCEKTNVEKIKNILIRNNVKFDDLYKYTQWFLKQIGVSY